MYVYVYTFGIVDDYKPEDALCVTVKNVESYIRGTTTIEIKLCIYKVGKNEYY